MPGKSTLICVLPVLLRRRLWVHWRTKKKSWFTRLSRRWRRQLLVHPRCWCETLSNRRVLAELAIPDRNRWPGRTRYMHPESMPQFLNIEEYSIWKIAVPMPSSSLNDVYVETCRDFALYFLFRHKKTSGAFLTSMRLGVDRQIRENLWIHKVAEPIVSPIVKDILLPFECFQVADFEDIISGWRGANNSKAWQVMDLVRLCQVQLLAVQALGEFGKVISLTFINHGIMCNHSHYSHCLCPQRFWHVFPAGSGIICTDHCWFAWLWCEEVGGDCSSSAPRRLLCIIVAGWDRRETQCSAKDADYIRL